MGPRGWPRRRRKLLRAHRHVQVARQSLFSFSGRSKKLILIFFPMANGHVSSKKRRASASVRWLTQSGRHARAPAVSVSCGCWLFAAMQRARSSALAHACWSSSPREARASGVLPLARPSAAPICDRVRGHGTRGGSRPEPHLFSFSALRLGLILILGLSADPHSHLLSRGRGALYPPRSE